MRKKTNIIAQSDIERFKVDYLEGLNSEQVAKRNEQKMNNVRHHGSNKSYLSIIINNLFTFFNGMYLLIFFLLLSANAEVTNYFFIIIVAANTLIGIIQEVRSKITIDKLSLLSESKVVVIRNSEKIEINIDEVVLDDIVYLTAGKEITTDSILVSGDIEVNESQLTGESVPVRKKLGDTLFSGSYVVSGNCYCKVERVGSENAMEKLAAQAKKYSKPRSDILRSLNNILKFVSIIIIPMGLLLFARAENSSGIIATFKALFNHSDTYSKSILSTSGALLGMIPSGLFLLTSMALAVGVIRLAKRKTLVQEIYCIETLARVDTLCLDKTGTITDGTMSVTRYIEQKKGEYNVTEIVASMNSALEESNSTARALEEYFGFSKKMKPVEILAFSSENKYSGVTFEKAGTFIIGAPEFVMKGNYERLSEEVNNYAMQGLRVIALAHSPLPLKKGKIQKQPKLVALILIEDRIRAEAFDTIKYFKDQGVKCKVISGDNPVTVAEVARRVGIDNAEDYISLENLTDEEVAEVANGYTVFGRVKPHQKQIIIKSLKAAKHTVAMTGDGVNDILALKEADCSIAMASGCDAVRNVAQLVLLDSNFASMPSVVAEGRRVINNIQQTASLFLVKTLFTMFISLLVVTGFISAFAPGGAGNYPFTASQLTMIEVFAIGVPAFVLSLQPNKERLKGKFLFNVIKTSLPGALTVLVEVIIIYMVSGPLQLTLEQVTTIIVIVATATCMMILYIACKPYTWWKILMYVVLAFCCVFITTQSVRQNVGRVFWFEIDWQRQYQLYELIIIKIATDGTEIINATPLLLVLTMAMSSYIIIFIANYVVDFFLGEKAKERRAKYKIKRLKND